MDEALVLDAEARLLLACSKLDYDERIDSLLGGPIRWDRLLSLGERHGLLPLLHRHLDGKSEVPPAVRARMWAAHEVRARRNGALSAELAHIVTALESRGISVVPFKGPTLAWSVYGDVALRDFGDLDLLVAPTHLHAAEGVMKSLGYTNRYPLAPAVREAFMHSATQYHIVLERPNGLVELHWKTDPNCPVERGDDPSWWHELPHIDFLGVPVRAFHAWELLLVLCLHGSKHQWASFGWAVDVAELLRREHALDWSSIRERARALGAQRRLLLGLCVVQRYLDVPLPDAIAQDIESHAAVRSMADAIGESLFEPEYRAPGAFEALRRDLSLHDRVLPRVTSLFGTIFAPSLVEWSRWPLPRPLFALYPPLRVLRLGGKYAARAFHRD